MFSFMLTCSIIIRKTRASRADHDPEELRMVRMLTIAHAARYACQVTRNQAQLWWGMIDKFEAATSYRQVSIPLHLRARTSTSEATSQSRPRCRDQDVINARTNARIASAVTTARVATREAKTNVAARRVDNARANLLALVN